MPVTRGWRVAARSLAAVAAAAAGADDIQRRASACSFVVGAVVAPCCSPPRVPITPRPLVLAAAWLRWRAPDEEMEREVMVVLPFAPPARALAAASSARQLRHARRHSCCVVAGADGGILAVAVKERMRVWSRGGLRTRRQKDK
jgi:hypothetical protein